MGFPLTSDFFSLGHLLRFSAILKLPQCWLLIIFGRNFANQNPTKVIITLYYKEMNKVSKSFPIFGKRINRFSKVFQSCHFEIFLFQKRRCCSFVLYLETNFVNFDFLWKVVSLFSICLFVCLFVFCIVVSYLYRSQIQSILNSARSLEV